MSIHKCPKCGREVGTNSTTGGAFKIPPILLCIHGDKKIEMEIISEADV